MASFDRGSLARHAHTAARPLLGAPGGRSSGGAAFDHHAVSAYGGVALVLGAALVAVAALVSLGHLWDRRRLAASGCWFEVRLGERVSRRALEAFLRTLAQGLPRRWFGAWPWVGLSVRSDEDRATLALFVSGGVPAAQVRAALEQALGGAMVQDATAAVGPVPTAGAACVRAAGLVATLSRFLPLRVDHGVDPAGQLLAALRAQAAGEGGAVQMVLQAPARSVRHRALREAAGLRAGRELHVGGFVGLLNSVVSFAGGMVDVFVASSGHGRGAARTASRPFQATDPFAVERARAIEVKVSQPLFAVTVRVASWAPGRRRARGRLTGLLAAFGQYHELGGLRRSREPSCARRLARCLPALRPPLVLGCGEVAALVAIPEESALAPLSFGEAPARRIAPVSDAPTHGLLLGRSNRSGFDRDLGIEPRALLQHAHVLGPTGRGKSTLLLNMMVEAIRAGMGGVVLDPTGELTNLILARIPQEQVGRVDLLDLGDTTFPPALNLLACPAGEGEAQAQAICGIFARLFSRFWGPRTEDILRSALTTLLSGHDPASAAPTLADVLLLLSDPSELSRYRTSDPVALDVFWRQWQTLSEPARVQALAPLSNKLRALLGNRALRNMLCQQAAPDMWQLIGGGRWLLVSLPQTLGEDAADLIGSVLLHRVWQAAQRLGPVAHSDRPPFLCLVDEYHRFCHLPQGMATALAQARGYGLGFVLAHQHLAQVADHGLLEAIDANCQTKLCFALQGLDAKRMAAHFEPRLNAYDLQHLGSYTIAARVLHDGRELPTATATTLPAPEPSPGDTAGSVRARARANATERRAVEETIRSRYGRIESPPIGRAQADAPGEMFDVDGAPFGASHDAPSDGAPSASTFTHHDTTLGSGADPDNQISFPVRGGRL
ncbi:MAG TPA: hypothetical protein VIJ39_14555 [Solirubrobacteraceae bacterium]